MKFFEEFTKSQKRTILLAALMASLLVAFTAIKDRDVVDHNINSYTRPKSYESDESVVFKVKIKDGEGTEKIINYSGTLAKQVPTAEAAEKYINEALNYCEKNLFKDGENAGNVKTGIKIIKSIPENPCDISYETDIDDALTSSGTINTKLIRSSRKVVLTITSSIEGYEKKSKTIDLILNPDKVTKDANMENNVTEELNTILGENTSAAAVKLPENIAGYEVKFVKEGERELPKVMLFSIFIVVAVVLLYKSKNDEKKDKRKEALLDSYADFTGRFVILLGAGLSLKAIWKKLSGEGKFSNELGVEIDATVRQMENGMAEYEAYENFGRRCGVENYIRFASILTQNLRFGFGKMLERLTTESESAMQERKNRACLNGNKADAKMMIPMILQFVLVIVIVMVPAMMMVE